MYQGHHNDGSSIQKHSAGSHYPYVVGKQEGHEEPWFVMDPSGAVLARRPDAAAAFALADDLAQSRRVRADRLDPELRMPAKFYASVFDGYSNRRFPIHDAANYTEASARFRNGPPGHMWVVVPEDEARRLGWV